MGRAIFLSNISAFFNAKWLADHKIRYIPMEDLIEVLHTALG